MTFNNSGSGIFGSAGPFLCAGLRCDSPNRKGQMTMSTSIKNFKLGMPKATAEKIILAQIMGDWVRDQYNPLEYDKVLHEAENAIWKTWNFGAGLTFLQWLELARKAFAKNIAYDHEAPENVVYREVFSRLTLTGAITLDRSDHIREVQHAVNQTAQDNLAEWIEGAIAMYLAKDENPVESWRAIKPVITNHFEEVEYSTHMPDEAFADLQG
jgi:hypothetical protein